MAGNVCKSSVWSFRRYPPGFVFQMIGLCRLPTLRRRARDCPPDLATGWCYPFFFITPLRDNRSRETRTQFVASKTAATVS